MAWAQRGHIYDHVSNGSAVQPSKVFVARSVSVCPASYELDYLGVHRRFRHMSESEINIFDLTEGSNTLRVSL